MIPTQRSLQLICRLAEFFSGIPFEWSNLFQRIYISRSRSKLFKWYFGVGLMALNTVFVAVRAVQASCCLKVTYGQWLITVFSAVTASSCTLVNLNNLAHRHEIIEVINQIWKVNGTISSLPIPPGTVLRKDYFKQISPTLFYFFFTYGYLQFFSAIVNVRTPKYFHSLVDLSETPKWKLIPIGLFDMCLILSGASTLSFGIAFFLTYMLSTKGCLYVLRDSPLATRDLVRYYKLLQILNYKYTACAKTFINTCMFGTTMVSYVISCYVVFKLRRELHPIAILAFGSIVGMNTLLVKNCFHNSYYLLKLSKEIIRTHQSRTRNRLTRRIYSNPSNQSEWKLETTSRLNMGPPSCL